MSIEILKFNLGEFVGRTFDNIDDTDLFRFMKNSPDLLGNDCWLAGGAIRRTLLGEREINSDYDLFFQTEETKIQVVEWLERMGATLIAKNKANACYQYKEYKIQCIHINYYQTPEEVLDTFDFTICQFATDGKTLYTTPYALFDLGRKRLVVHKITYPVASLRRLLKYTGQGFYACSGCLNKLLEPVALNPSLLDSKFKYID